MKTKTMLSAVTETPVFLLFLVVEPGQTKLHVNHVNRGRIQSYSLFGGAIAFVPSLNITPNSELLST